MTGVAAAPYTARARAGRNQVYLDSAATRKLFASDHAGYRKILGDLGMLKTEKP